jgi:glycerol uptake facilitator protein
LWRNLVSEVIGTCVLVFSIYFIVEGEGLGSLNALPVGIIVIVIGMALGGTTGYAINPARDLGPRLVHATFFKDHHNWNYSWIPVVGPTLGALLAALIFQLIS